MHGHHKKTGRREPLKETTSEDISKDQMSGGWVLFISYCLPTHTIPYIYPLDGVGVGRQEINNPPTLTGGNQPPARAIMGRRLALVSEGNLTSAKRLLG